MEIQIPPTSITIVAGNILLEGASVTRQERIVKKITIHRKFDKDTLENDIALLQVFYHFKTFFCTFISLQKKK